MFRICQKSAGPFHYKSEQNFDSAACVNLQLAKVYYYYFLIIQGHCVCASKLGVCEFYVVRVKRLCEYNASMYSPRDKDKLPKCKFAFKK